MHSKIQGLGDLELAILICLVAQEHCIFSTSYESKHDLRDEVRLICESTFGLQLAVIECSPQMTVDEFNEGILVEVKRDEDDYFEPQESRDQPRTPVDFTYPRVASSGRLRSNTLDRRQIADVLITTDLDMAGENVQIQALELLRTKRIFTRTAMHTAPRDFMMLSIASKQGARLSHHLNDLFCISHSHSDEDGFPFVNGQLSKDLIPSFSGSDIRELRALAAVTRFTPELAAYLHNIVVFMRSSRYIKGGVTATATRHHRTISKILAPLHGLSYVPPSLVALAAHKIYPHRIKLATPETERSLQWGSDPTAVRQLLEGFTIEDAIGDVLASVETPL